MTEPNQASTQARSPQLDDSHEGSIDMVELLRAVLHKRKLILLSTFGMGLLFAVWALLSHSVYESYSSVLPPQTSSEGQNLLAAGARSSMFADAEIKSVSDLYVYIMSGYTLQADVVRRCKLVDAFHAGSVDEAVNRLSASTTFNAIPSTSVIEIRVKDRDPKLAAKIVQGYLDALTDLSSRLALTSAAQRRVFFQKELSKEKDDLEKAEVGMKSIQERTGLISPGAQTASELQSIMSTRAAIMERQTQLAALLESATDQNPQVIRLRTEIATLEAQMSAMRHGTSPDASGTLPTSKVPEAQLEIVRQQREVSYHEMLYDMLAKQLEAARLDESHSSTTIQVIDPPRIPLGPTGPNRRLRVVVGLILGFFGSLAWAILSGPIYSVWHRIKV